MKTLITLLMAFTLLFSFALAEDASAVIIGGADGPTAVFVADADELPVGSVTLSFDANITTGFEWTAFVLGGSSIVIDEEHSGYVSDASADPTACGVGGTHYFKLDAAESGESIIRFSYRRGWEEGTGRDVIMYAVVDEEMHIFTMDVTESGVFEGVVTEVDSDAFTATVDTAESGEIIAQFPAETAMPVPGEQIRVYTNGIMTMSLPPIVNVIAWEALPSEDAR